ncbi:hypothetical protein B0H13DRAFT_2366860 [Mycena leptocephala]|nr:hypothetical protein B0H13DRAFT_2366860 [Mycena leptocephala]
MAPPPPEHATSAVDQVYEAFDDSSITLQEMVEAKLSPGSVNRQTHSALDHSKLRTLCSFMSDDDGSYAPSSDDVIFPGFSQRDETVQEVEQENYRLGLEYEAQQQRREIRAQLALWSIESITDSRDDLQPPRASALTARNDIQGFYQPNEALDSQATSQQWLEARVRGGLQEVEEEWENELAAPAMNHEENYTEDTLDFELLRLQYYEVETERDEAQAECIRLRTELAQAQAKLRETQTSLKFFQKETGRWRWAAASAHTKIQAFLRDLGAAAMVLRFPDGQPSGSGN